MSGIVLGDRQLMELTAKFILIMRQILIRIFYVLMAVILSSGNIEAFSQERGKPVMCVFGDSYVRNHRCPPSETWHSKVAARLGYEYVNCGRNGSSMGLDRRADGFGPAMTQRLGEFPDRADIILIIAGHNDADMIAAGRPYTLEDFSSSLNQLLDSIAIKYPDAAVGYVTPWNVDRPMFGEVIAEIKRVCGERGVAVLDAANESGIMVNDPEFRSKYFQNGGVRDTAHLNDAGHNLLVDWGEDFVKRLSGKAFEIKAGDKVEISLPATSREVLTTAAGILSADISKVLDSETVIGKGISNPDIEVVIDAVRMPEPEGFIIEVNPQGRLVITGHDSHGAAYGLLEISRMLGVSPWEWWADSKPAKRSEFRIGAGFLDIQSPDVAYRGIFINDEDWGLMPWSSKHYEPSDKPGVIGPATTEKIFELLLRLRANYYWPPMHECSEPFFLTPGNREVASRYGIYIGGSHCEPMASSTAVEWGRRGKGEYDYVNNSKNVRRFWEDRLREVKDQEIVYTLGMRGVHDSGMKGASGVDAQKDALTEVIADQRKMLGKYVNKNVTDVPQVFIPYKEVLDVYNAGLAVPEDVTLMWCDDNYGYIRHFPTESERQREGGNGVYYHASYWGRPHDYLWLQSFSPALLYNQMNEAYDRGIQEMWILNVGDIKPSEYQTELFLDLAWDNDGVRDLGLRRHLGNFLKREFGDETGSALLPVVLENYRLGFVSKPEFMGHTRTEEKDRKYYSTVRDMPWSEKYMKSRIADYDRISDAVENIESIIPAEKRDTYFQLVKYPVQAASQMNRKMAFATSARHGEEDWSRSDAAYDSIATLTARYNRGFNNNGKWNGIMDFKPRRLPVFDRVARDANPGDGRVADEMVDARFNGNQGEGQFVECEELGYDGGAVRLIKDEALKFRLPDVVSDSVTVTLHFIPTHAVGDEGLKVEVKSGKEAKMVDYATQGRSEEWKRNVLFNRATRRVKLPASKIDGVATIEIRPVTDGVILDQVEITDR